MYQYSKLLNSFVMYINKLTREIVQIYREECFELEVQQHQLKFEKVKLFSHVTKVKSSWLDYDMQ